MDNSCPPFVGRLGLDPGYLAIFIYPILWPMTPTIAVVSAVMTPTMAVVSAVGRTLT